MGDDDDVGDVPNGLIDTVACWICFVFFSFMPGRIAIVWLGFALKGRGREE